MPKPLHRLCQRLVLALGLLAAAGLALAAQTPVLMVLEHTEAGKRIETRIEIKDGLVVSPDKGKAREKWVARAGEAVKSDVRPGDRAVNFYKSAGGENFMQLFAVKVRYFQNKEGRWAPHFQLNEEPLVVRDGKRWKPLTTIQGVPNLIVMTGATLPNAEGYYPSLEFGFTTGATTIDAWLIQ